MARISKEQRREARRRRMRQGQEARQGIRIVPNCIDLSKLPSKPKIYEFKKRNNEIDILPFIVSMDWYPDLRDLKPYEIGPKLEIKPGEDDYKLQYCFHPRLGAEKKDYLCLRHMFGKACPACEELDPIWEKKKDDRTKKDLEKAKAIKHKWRCLYNIYDYHDPDTDVALWDISYYLFEDYLQDKIEGDEDGILDFTDPEEGKTITFDGKEGSLSTRENTYYEADGIRFKDRDPYEESIYDETFPLDTLLVIPTYDEIAKALLYMDTEDDTSAETETSGRRGRRSRRKEEDSPTEERPSRGRRGRREPDQPEEDDLPPHVEGTCPEGLEFGVDCNTDDKCQECDQTAFDACSEYFELLEKKKKEEAENRSGSRRRSRLRR